MSDNEPHDPHMAAAASYAVASSDSTNKWSKNGFGHAVSSSAGKFTPEESEVVRRAVEDFCLAKGISTARLCSECDHKAELKGAWMEIAKRLPHRSVQSVYRHGIRQLHPFKRGAWSEQECQMLSELVQRMGKKWSAIQSKLHRSADSCRDKYREMSEEFVKGRWKEHEIEQLKKIIREQLNASPDADMRELGRLVEEHNIQIPWSSISKRMSKRSRLSCFKKWQKLSGVGLNTAPDDDREADEHSPLRHKRQKTTDHDDREFDDVYSAKIAAETVEAVELPDVV